MSWQSYVDDHLMVELPGGGMLSHAAIFGQHACAGTCAQRVGLGLATRASDGNPWALSSGFPTPDPSYIQAIVNTFDDPSGLSGVGGLKFGEIKYIMIGGEEGSVIRGKFQQGGITIKKTVSAMVIGIYPNGVQPGDCNVIVENLGDYLIGQGI
eukprot:1185469-Prorocentrum_minimum.AAC.4